MKEYHKIQTVFKRDPFTNNKTLQEGEYSLPEFEYLKDNLWIFTEKVDGTNIRVIFDGTDDVANSVKFFGKTGNAEIPLHLLSTLSVTFSFSRIFKMREIFKDIVCLYGEGYGAKIQKGGGNYRQDQGFVLFDVKIGDWWLKRENVNDIASKLGLEQVPIVGMGTLSDMVEMTRQGFQSVWGPFTAEGIVARPATELFSRNGERIITKIKHKDFKKS